MRQRNARLPARAIIEEGFAVAAADHQLRPGDLRAESRLDRADARQVEPAAGSGLELTEQAGIALLSEKPPLVLPTPAPTALAPVGIAVNNAIAAANEIAMAIFNVASLFAFNNYKNNQRL